MQNVKKIVIHVGNRTLPTRHFAYFLDSSPTGFHIVYALIQLCNAQQKLHDHYRHGSRTNSRMSILAVTGDHWQRL